jgi:predicted transcriptional regulator
MRAVLAVILMLVGAHVGADIYKKVDEEGRVTYSNVPSKGAQKLNLEPINTVPSSKPNAQPPGNFPKVDADTQKGRDSKRRQVLEDELAQEMKQLDEAKKALAEAEATRLGDERNYQKFLDRVQPFKDAVADHKKNIDALKEEIAGLR